VQNLRLQWNQGGDLKSFSVSGPKEKVFKYYLEGMKITHCSNEVAFPRNATSWHTPSVGLCNAQWVSEARATPFTPRRAH